MPRESYRASKVLLICRILRAHPAAFWAIVVLPFFTTFLKAQERVRSSAEPPLIQAFRRSPEAFFYLGPLQVELEGTATAQYTDNVELSNTNKISDLSFRLGLSMDNTWVVSHLNQLQFNFGGEIIQNFYGNGRSQLNFAVDPNSRIEFLFEISDFKIRIFDQFSFTQNPTSDPTATNTANLNSLTNTIGVAVDTDLSLAILTLAADYTYNTQSGTNVQGQNNASTTGTRQSFRLGPTLTFRLSPTILYGFNAAATRSSSSDAANVNNLSFGPFIKGNLSREFEFDLAVGGNLVDTTPAIPAGYYFAAAARYQVNKYWQLLFSGSHDLVFTTGTELTEENLFQLGTQFGITRYIVFSVAPFVNFGDVKTTGPNVNTSSGGGNYTQFGVEARVGWKFRKRWTSALIYDFVRRESGSSFGTGTEASNNYIQNTIALTVGYAF